MRAIDVAGVHGSHNVRVINLPDGPHFPFKARDGSGRLHKVRWQQFEGDQFVESHVPGFEDLAHAAFAQQFHEFVLAKDTFIEGGFRFVRRCGSRMPRDRIRDHGGVEIGGLAGGGHRGRIGLLLRVCHPGFRGTWVLHGVWHWGLSCQGRFCEVALEIVFPRRVKTISVFARRTGNF